MKIGLKLVNMKNRKSFIKYFDTEHQRECYIRRAKHFKNIVVLERVDEYEIGKCN